MCTCRAYAHNVIARCDVIDDLPVIINDHYLMAFAYKALKYALADLAAADYNYPHLNIASIHLFYL